jgi:hypothetical protein
MSLSTYQIFICILHLRLNLTFRRLERNNIDNLAQDETETSSVMQIRKGDSDKKDSLSTSIHSEKPDTVLYLREINKYLFPIEFLTLQVVSH